MDIANRSELPWKRIRQFICAFSIALVVLIPIAMLIGDPKSPYWMAALFAYWFTRPDYGYANVHRMTLVWCAIGAALISLCAIPIQNIFPFAVPEWYVGPVSTVIFIAILGSVMMGTQRFRALPPNQQNDR